MISSDVFRTGRIWLETSTWLSLTLQPVYEIEVRTNTREVYSCYLQKGLYSFLWWIVLVHYRGLKWNRYVLVSMDRFFKLARNIPTSNISVWHKIPYYHILSSTKWRKNKTIQRKYCYQPEKPCHWTTSQLENFCPTSSTRELAKYSVVQTYHRIRLVLSRQPPGLPRMIASTNVPDGRSDATSRQPMRSDMKSQITVVRKKPTAQKPGML